MSAAQRHPPEALLAALAELRQRALERYGEPMIGLRLTAHGLVGWVALHSQAELVRGLLAQHWPGSEAHLLTLAERKARVGLHAGPAGLDVWRKPPHLGPAAGELTTQLQQGDPPAQVVAARSGQFLVRAPGQAIGWVSRLAEFQIGAPELPTSERPVDITVAGAVWRVEVVVETALGQQGRPYLWGGTGLTGVDCSGLLWRAFLTAGILLPKNSRAQRQVGIRVRRDQMRRGDLVGAVSRGPRRTSHVALALSGEEVVHACSEQQRVRRELLVDFQDRYRILTVRRIPGGQHDPR